MPAIPPIITPRTGLPAWLRVVVFAVSALLCWLPVLGNPGFCNHDELELLHELRGQGPLHVLAELGGNLASTGTLFYRPLGFTLLRAQLALAGGVPELTHALSFLHHLANVALLGLLLQRLRRPTGAAWLLLLLPAALPAVAWVAGAYERWLLTFALATLLLLAAERRSRHWLALLTFALAICTKETAVVLPPIALLLVWRRHPGARVVAALMLVAAITFAVWRSVCAPANPDYHPHTTAEAALSLLRLMAFPCAVSAGEPQQVWGTNWIPGLLGIAVLTGLALQRSPRIALAACVTLLLPLLPVAAWSTPQGHYLYLAAPGLALLVQLAIGPRPDWRWLLLLVLIAHSVVIALYFHAVGTAMTNLDRAWRELPKSLPVVSVTVLPGAEGHVVRRYSRYVANIGGQPLLQEREGEPLPGNLVLHPDGTVNAVR